MVSDDAILVGCCGFPIGRARYAREFDLVEVQQTFYQLPSPALAGKWRAEAPTHFVFTMKAWQLITHEPASPTYRRLKEPLSGPPEAYGRFQRTPEVERAWQRTLEVARALASPIVVFQCPARFRPEPGNVANLRRFFESAERDGVTFAWEPRGPWPEDLVAALCRELDLVHCVDPFAAEEAHGRIAYYRLHGIGGYRYRYTDEDLAALLDRCGQALRSGRRAVYVMFNNVFMLDDARRFLARARGGRSGRH